MKKRRGLSLEEKRDILLGIYHNKQEVFNLSEVEKLGSRAGIVLQSIKEVNQQLLDDGLIESDKIGAGNFYWSFPAKAIVACQRKTEESRTQISDITERVEMTKKEIGTCEAERRETNERKRKIHELETVNQERSELNGQYEEIKENDPEIANQVIASSELCVRATNRWIDNIFSLKSWLVLKKGIPSTQVDQMLSIDEDFDYIH